MAVWSGHIAPALHLRGRDGAYTVSINVPNRCQEMKFVFHNLRNLMRKFMFSFMVFPPKQTGDRSALNGGSLS